MKKHLVALGVALLAFGALPVIALANTGGVKAAQDCQKYTASAFLDNNVTIDKTVVVTTSIPGKTGLSKHYDTTKVTGQTQIWAATGSAVKSGWVSLTIYNGNGSIDGSAYKASLPIPASCPTPSPTSSPSSTPTPTPTPTPTGGTSPATTNPPTSPGGGQGQGVLAANTTAPGLPAAGAGANDPNGLLVVAFAVALVSVLAIARVVKTRR